MSKDIVISVEHLSKMYRLGRVSSGSFGHDLKRWWASVRGKEDPFTIIASENDRTQRASESEYVWALKDVSFELSKGDVLGIIGRNGAGKSTLLKMLTRVTLPTTGNIKARGRIASLLEVGTGFHPDLTGRENIFLNGAILGMRKSEIKKKFDEIVDFSGVDRYIDTPVKRYSSGMYVRLAFGVAAHLESEILIIDEVLAVGDAEFQKKCLGKMGDIANREGRTVLFVSHNIAAVKQMCNKGLFLANGRPLSFGKVSDVIDLYAQKGGNIIGSEVFFNDKTVREGNQKLVFEWLRLKNKNGQLTQEYSLGDDIEFHFKVKNISQNQKVEFAIQIITTDDIPLFHMMCRDSNFNDTLIDTEQEFSVVLKDIRLFPDTYRINITAASTTGHEVLDHINGATSFQIVDGGSYTTRNLPRVAGVFFMNPEWKKV
jgi:lipopolysaccharide transport system ATP-binding protein